MTDRIATIMPEVLEDYHAQHSPIGLSISASFSWRSDRPSKYIPRAGPARGPR